MNGNESSNVSDTSDHSVIEDVSDEDVSDEDVSDSSNDHPVMTDRCYLCDSTDDLTQTAHQQQTGPQWICPYCRRDLEGSSYGESSYGSPDVEDPGHEDSWSADDEEDGNDGPSTGFPRFRSSVLVSG